MDYNQRYIFCHVYLNISNCPILIAVVLFQYTVLSCTSALIDDQSSCSTVNVAETVESLLSDEELIFPHKYVRE